MAVAVVSGKQGADTKIGRDGSGLASWYGDRFHGRPTANGERFDMGGFTAAHPSFPLPSYVRVTNASNGRSIVVRVNDRGPFHGGRIIDVSRQTADVLGFRGSGVGTVRLDYLGAAPRSRSDDRRLLASYQEFGRPSVPAGVQMAAMTPVSDAELAAETSTPTGGAFAVASAAVATSAAALSSSAAAVASGAKAAARKLLPADPAPVAPQTVAAAAPLAPPVAATAYAAPQPILASVPAAIAAPKQKRVVAPAAPALASSTPGLPPVLAPDASRLAASTKAVDVSSRIAASFEGFGGGQTSVRTGRSLTADALR